MNDVPLLTRHDVTEQLEKLYRTRRERHLIAFFGAGTEEVVTVASGGTFRIVPVRSELDLRDRMPPLADEDARVAFLLPWNGEVPLDLAGRFALSGRIVRVGPEARLLRLLGATEIDADARKSPLAGYLLQQTTLPPIAVPAGRLTISALFDAWLGAAWGLDVTGGLGLDLLLGWAALDQRGSRFQDAMRAPGAAGVRDALLAHLSNQLGPAGPVVWRAWEAGRGRAALEYALLFETLASSEHAGVRMWLKMAPRGTLDAADDVEMVAVATALGASADAALRYVQRRADAMTARSIVHAADARAGDPEVRDALARDRRLPSAWRARLDALGRALTDVAAAPSAESVNAAVAAQRAVEAHSFFTDIEQTPVAERAEMGVRLAAWLAARPDRRFEGAPTPHGDAERLARWYATEGGYVDWARRVARGTAEDAFGRGVQSVVAAVDAARQELDLRFARSLASWIEAGRPSSQVVPIDHAIRRIAARFLEEDASRKLLVLLLDGMAWMQAVEILQSLATRTVPWGPVGWHASSRGKIGEGIYPAVLATLPTVTEVSRAAFFAGKHVLPGAPGNTSKDPDRWAENRDAARFVDAMVAPRLLLRAEGHTREGSASSEALSLVSDSSRRLVAIVINAIDSSLKGDPQLRHAWTAESIRSLPELLDRAREAGRVVLMASDHGHVPADRLEAVGPVNGGGARWRPWLRSDEPLGPSEIGFRGEGVWSPRGAHGVVLLADDASRYGGAAHAGEHGGATLAEVVAPCVLIGCEDLTAVPTADRALAAQSAYVPPWWHLEVRASVEARTEVPVEPPARPKKASDDRQLTLPSVDPGAPSAAASLAPTGTRSAFATSAVLASLQKREAERKQVVDAVEFLLERQGVATEAAFASAMGVAVWRIGGIVSKLQEVLNVDGYQVLRYDAVSKQIHLDRDKLAQQFEVSL